MNRRILIGLGLMAVLLGGCVVGNRALPEGTLAPTEDQAGWVRVRMESRPNGALILSGGRVIGHTPLVMSLPVTRHGFFPEATTVRARFRAEDESFGALTATASFTVSSKVPSAVVFTPDGYTWIP